MARKTEFSAEVIKKYLFWACTPIGLAAALLAGWMAIGSIADDLEKQKTQLDNQKKQMETLRGTANNHPNEGTISAINQKAEELKENVLDAWEIMVAEQKKQNQWTGLADRAYRDIEKTAFLGTLEGTTLDSYMTFARDELDKLLVNANIRRVQQYKRLPNGQEEPLDQPRLASRSGGSGGMGAGRGGDTGSARGGQSGLSSAGSRTQIPDGGTIIVKGKVVWDQPESLVFTLNNWNDRPQSFEVWLTQEDLWVYQALLWVVAESNKDAPEPWKPVVSGGSTGGMGSSGMGTSSGMGSPGTGGDPLDLRGSVVKQIIDISIGAPAAKQLETQSSRRISGRGGGGGMGSSGMGGGMGSSSMGGGMGRTGAAGARSRESAAGQRYVDVTGKPLNIDSALSGQFRRMPVFLSFLVDQRRIPEILVNCANCPMPIDVLWVTINPSATENFAFASNTAAGGSVGTGSGMGSGISGSVARGGSRSSSRGGTASSGGAARGGGSMGRSGAGSVQFGPDAVQIEIYGCINIFADPDPEKISGKSSTAVSGITPSR